MQFVSVKTTQTSTNGTDWVFLREAVSAVGDVADSFTVRAQELAAGALLRGISLDSLAVTNALPPLIWANGSADGSDLILFAHQPDPVSLSVPVYGDVGQSITWLRNGQPVGTGSPLVVSTLDPRAAGTYQAVVSYPFGQFTSDQRQISLIELRAPVLSGGLPAADGSALIHIEADPAHPERPVRLDVSTDLRHWETLTSGSGSFDFTLPPATGPTQFIRAVVE